MLKDTSSARIAHPRRVLAHTAAGHFDLGGIVLGVDGLLARPPARTAVPASLRLNLPLEKGETVVVEAQVVSVEQWRGEPAWDLRFERVPPPIQQKIVQFVTARAAVDRSAGGIDPRVPEPKAREAREREQDRQRRQGAQTRPATPRRASSGTLLGAAITPDQPLPAVQSASTKQPTPRLLPAVVEQAPRPTGAAFPCVARDDDDGDKRPPRGAVSLSPSRRRRRS